MMKTLITILGLVALVPACYRYVPETATEPMVGGSYRATLTPTGAQTMTKYLGSEVTSFEARILSTTDSAYLVAMAQTMSRLHRRPVLWTGDQLTIPRSTIATFERRELDRNRSMRYAALYTVGAIAAGAVWFSISGKVSSTGNPGPGPINP
jgi:hypothetical protein